MSGALSLALNELELPFVPGSQARKVLVWFSLPRLGRAASTMAAKVTRS
jgi:hypothetical protein